MKATLIQYWEGALASYWFIPSVMSAGAIVLALVTTRVDAALGAGWSGQVDWLYLNRPDGARALLSTIAGSMLTIAALTFSITIAAVAYATSQFGPRLLTNFMRDRGNQFTLGTFIATFLYCLLVLRTISSAEEPGTAFVPHLSLLCAFALALLSIGVLIFFIHHVPQSIHASKVVAGIGGELNRKIEDLFPEMIGRGPEANHEPKQDVPEDLPDRAAPLPAADTGYLQHLDEEGILNTATEHDLILRLAYRPGDFVSAGQTLLHAYPAARVDEKVARRLRNAFAQGWERTPRQDVLFLAYELAEIGTRALSLGINDPFTTITCLNWLGSALITLSRRELPGAYRYDAEGRLRVIARPITFETFAETAFTVPHSYIERDPNAALHMMELLGEIAQCIEPPAHRLVLRRHADALLQGGQGALTHDDDRAALERLHRAAVRLLRDQPSAAP